MYCVHHPNIQSNLTGYICIILFGCCVSPIALSELSYLSMSFRSLHDMYRIFLIMPEGIRAWFPGTLIPVNLSIAARTFFWIFLFTFCLLPGSKSRCKKWLMPVMILLIIGDFVYMYMPASYYSCNGSYGKTDSELYDQMAYMIDKTVTEKENGNEFAVSGYQMELTMGRMMETSVFIYPADKELSEYPMTLYHLYEIESVMDESGTELPYDREGDYLTVKNPSGQLESICVNYKGSLANFYANAEFINLPGWFAYYPVPGYRVIYKDYEYVDNSLEEPVMFDITVNAHKKVYSDLKQVDENHFMGENYGVTLVCGFMKETELEGGIRCIYPYLDKTLDPTAEAAKEYCENVLEYVRDDWTDTQEKTIVLLPVDAGMSEVIRENSMIAGTSWRTLEENLKDDEPDMQEITNLFLTWYSFMMEDSSVELNYENLKEEWDSIREDLGAETSTDEEFEEFVLEQLGQEQWDRIMKSKR